MGNFERNKITGYPNPENLQKLPEVGFYFMTGEHEDDLYIAANKEGLHLLAAKLLEAAESVGFHNGVLVQETETDCSDLCNKGDYTLNCIKVYSDKLKKTDESVNPNETLRDKLLNYCVLCLLLFICICLIWGFISIVKSIFGLFF